MLIENYCIGCGEFTILECGEYCTEECKKIYKEIFPEFRV